MFSVIVSPRSSYLFPQICGDLRDLVQRRLQVFGNLGGYHVGVGKIGRVLQALVFKPENIQAYLVSLEQVFVGEGLETFRLFALVTVLGVIAGDEIVQVSPLQRIGSLRWPLAQKAGVNRSLE